MGVGGWGWEGVSGWGELIFSITCNLELSWSLLSCRLLIFNWPASHQQQRPRIVSGPSHLVIGKKHGNITFDWTFKLLPGRTWIESVEDVAFGFWKAPGYLKTKLMVIGKYGKVMTRQNYGNKVSCTFNMSVLQLAFTVHNLSTGDENDYGLHIELGLARNPLKDIVALRLEGNCNINYIYLDF